MVRMRFDCVVECSLIVGLSWVEFEGGTSFGCAISEGGRWVTVVLRLGFCIVGGVNGVIVIDSPSDLVSGVGSSKLVGNRTCLLLVVGG